MGTSQKCQRAVFAGSTLVGGQPSVAREVDETALDVGADQLHADVVAHVETLEPALQPPFDRRLEDPYPRSLRRGAGDEAVELLSIPAGQEQSRCRLPDPPLDLGGVVLSLRAMLGKFRPLRQGLGKRCRRRAPLRPAGPAARPWWRRPLAPCNAWQVPPTPGGFREAALLPLPPSEAVA